MKNNKAFAILSTFSKREMNDFRKLITSPYFNKSKNVIKLFDILRRNHPEFNSRSLSIVNIYPKIFMKKDVNTKVINNLFTRLIKLTLIFISTRNFLNNPRIVDNCLLNEYRSRGLDSMLFNTAKRLISGNLIKDPDSSDYYHYYNYRLHLVEYQYRSMVFGKEKDISKQLSELHNLIENYYYHNLLKIFARAAVSSFVKFKRFEKGLESLLNEIYAVSGYVTHPARVIISSLALSFIKNKSIRYHWIRVQLEKIKDQITNEDHNLILILLNSYFMPIINEDDKILIKQRLELVKLLVERQAWVTIGGEFIEHNFTYAVDSALKAGELEWAERFIKNYSRYINNGHREDAVNYSLARLYYEKARTEKVDIHKYYEIASEYLYKYRTIDCFRKLKAFELDTMILFDTEQFDQLLYHCDTYVHYLHHHYDNFDNAIYNAHLNFADFAVKLTKFTIDGNSNKAQALKGQIKKSQFCINRSWLIKNTEKIQ